jgi:hypothetical protein
MAATMTTYLAVESLIEEKALHPMRKKEDDAFLSGCILAQMTAQ